LPNINILERESSLSKRLEWAKRKIYKSRVGRGKSTASEAKVVAKNEALKLMLSGDMSKNRIEEIISRAIGLDKPDNPIISPFAPKNGFYVVDFEKLEKGLIVYLRGSNLFFSTFKFVEFMLKKVYDAHITDGNKNFQIYCGSTPVGVGCIYGSYDNKCIKIKIGEFEEKGRFKKREQILLRFFAKGRMIKILMFSPSYVIEKLIPRIKEMKEEYSQLRITSSRLFLRFVESYYSQF
jgi:hypothetical protein